MTAAFLSYKRYFLPMSSQRKCSEKCEPSLCVGIAKHELCSFPAGICCVKENPLRWDTFPEKSLQAFLSPLGYWESVAGKAMRSHGVVREGRTRAKVSQYAQGILHSTRRSTGHGLSHSQPFSLSTPPPKPLQSFCTHPNTWIKLGTLSSFLGLELSLHSWCSSCRVAMNVFQCGSLPSYVCLIQPLVCPPALIVTVAVPVRMFGVLFLQFLFIWDTVGLIAFIT